MKNQKCKQREKKRGQDRALTQTERFMLYEKFLRADYARGSDYLSKNFSFSTDIHLSGLYTGCRHHDDFLKLR